MDMEAGTEICEECGEGVPSKSMKRHKQRRHDKRTFQCDECGVTVTGYEKHQAHKVKTIVNWNF